MATKTDQAPETKKPEEQKLGATSLGPTRATMRRNKIHVKFVVAGAVLALLAITYLLYRHYSQFESTDDAQIDGYIYPVSARVSGYVTAVLVDDDQFVKAGTPLVRLDPKDYNVAVANARAAYANDKASAAVQQTTVPITSVSTSSQVSSAGADLEAAQAGLVGAERQYDAAQASLLQAQANDLKAQDDVNRYQPLATKDEIPPAAIYAGCGCREGYCGRSGLGTGVSRSGGTGGESVPR